MDHLSKTIIVVQCEKSIQRQQSSLQFVHRDQCTLQSNEKGEVKSLGKKKL